MQFNPSYSLLILFSVHRFVGVKRGLWGSWSVTEGKHGHDCLSRRGSNATAPDGSWGHGRGWCCTRPYPAPFLFPSLQRWQPHPLATPPQLTPPRWGDPCRSLAAWQIAGAAAISFCRLSVWRRLLWLWLFLPFRFRISELCIIMAAVSGRPQQFPFQNEDKPPRNVGQLIEILQFSGVA